MTLILGMFTTHTIDVHTITCLYMIVYCRDTTMETTYVIGSYPLTPQVLGLVRLTWIIISQFSSWLLFIVSKSCLQRSQTQQSGKARDSLEGVELKQIRYPDLKLDPHQMRTQIKP